MPYLQQHHVKKVRESREQQQQQPGSDRQPPTPEEARMQAQHNIVKHQVEELLKSNPARSTEEEDFYQYQIDVNNVIFQGTYSSIYLASHSQLPDVLLVGRVYEPTARIDPQRSSYMKVLHHIGRKNTGCIGTYDIFYDDAGRVVIFQEFACHGNLKDYLKTNNVYVPEPQMHDWAVQIYRGLDFLGDAGICHRSLSPKHILLTNTSDDDTNKVIVKLGSFRDSFIYFDPVLNQVKPVPCREKKGSAGANFTAPEVFAKDGGGGRGDQVYDPIAADTWSYGATFFFATTRYLPLKNHSASDPNAEIQKTINYARNLSPEAKNWFTGILNADPAKRTTFDQVGADAWFTQGPAKQQQQQSQENQQEPSPQPKEQQQQM